MQRTGTVPIAMCLWPGLTRLWYLGHWSALGIAIGFGCLLNFGLISKFVWPELVNQHVTVIVWSIAITLWAFCGWKQYRERSELLLTDPHPQTDNDPMLFEAQCEYLAGRLDDAVSLLERILFKDPRDVESRLLLATIRRRQFRFEDADEQLTAIRKFDGSVKWAAEIENEINRLDSDEKQFDEAANNSELDADSSGTAIPETSELETIESTDQESVRKLSDVDESDVETIVKPKAETQHTVVPSEADSIDYEISDVAIAQESDTQKSDDATHGLSITEQFERRLSEISVPENSRRTDGLRNRRTDAA